MHKLCKYLFFFHSNLDFPHNYELQNVSEDLK